MGRSGNRNVGLLFGLLVGALPVVVGCTPGGGGGVGGAKGSKLKAEVSNGAFVAQVEYSDLSSRQTMGIVVTGGTPGATLDISVAGVTIASVTLDDQGNGRLDFSSSPAAAGEEPLPDGFQPPSAGDAMAVGDLTDSFDSVQAELKAHLSSAKFRADVNYEVDSAKVKFRVHVQGGEANAVLDVGAAGFAVGTITLDADGNGKMRWSSRTDHPGEEPLPAGFPALAAGDTVSVGSLSGTLSHDNGENEGDDHGNNNNNDHSGSELRAEMSSGQQVAKVSFEQSQDETEVSVTVSGGAADAVLEVSIAGASLGSVALDATGAAAVEFTSDPGASGKLHLPASFTAPVAGDAVTVGEMSGVFAADGDGNGDDGGSSGSGNDNHADN